MPYGGYDPINPGGPIVDSGTYGAGGWIDPSYNYSLAPGGRFPGDDYYFLEYLASMGRGGDPADPNAHVWGEGRQGLIGRIARLIGNSRRNSNGPGGVSNPYETDPYQMYSNQSGAYGPNRGLVDIGTGNIFDGEAFGNQVVTTGSSTQGGRRKGGGGGNYNGPTGWANTAAMNFKPQFMDWQPGNTGPTRWVGGGPSSTPPPLAANPPKPTRKPRPIATPAAGTPQSGVSTPARPAASGSGTSGSAATGTGSSRSPLSSLSPDTASALLSSYNAWRSQHGLQPVASLPELEQQVFGGQQNFAGNPAYNMDNGSFNFRGYDTNMLDRGTAGWMRDPTTGVYDTSGMPGRTPVPPMQGETTDEYITRLHDMGFSNEEVIGLVTGYGTSPWDSGDLVNRTQQGPNPHQTVLGDWGWGTGPVVGNPEGGGYHFANQGQSSVTGGDLGIVMTSPLPQGQAGPPNVATMYPGRGAQGTVYYGYGGGAQPGVPTGTMASIAAALSGAGGGAGGGTQYGTLNPTYGGMGFQLY